MSSSPVSTAGRDRLLRAAERAVYGNFQALPSADAHGTGDVFVSALCGELMNGKGMPQALKDAAKFCDDCVQKTAKRGESHWYGLAFEDKLKEGRGL